MKYMKYLFLLYVVTVAFLTPISQLMITVGFLISMDFIFGIMRSIKIGGWKSITSRKMGNTVSKMLGYQLAIITMYVMEQYIIKTDFITPLIATKLATTTICIVELKSLSESFKTLYGFDIFSKIPGMFKRSISDTKNDNN